MRTRRLEAAFTLIEVLGVILVTTILISVAIDFFINLSRQATRASENTREVRRAATLLDRVASDLEHALLFTKPAELDPLAHPWIFLAEPQFAEDGSDQIQFVMRRQPRARAGPGSDLALVAFTTHRSEDGEGLVLRRWSSPELPESLDDEFPRADDPRSFVLADGIQSFSARFLDGGGEWLTSWDSSQIAESGALPLAVRLEVALMGSEEEALDLEPGARLHARLVMLPMRPLDLAALLDPESEAGEEGDESAEGDGDLGDLTLADCIDFSKVGAAGAGGLSGTDLSTLSALSQQAGDTPFAPYAGLLAGHPAVRAQCR